MTAIVCSAASLIFYYASFFGDWMILIYTLPPVTLLIAVIDRLRRTPPGIERQQTKAVLFGIAVFCVLLVVNNILVQMQLVVTAVGPSSWLILTAHLAVAFSGIAIPAGLLVSLLRFRLYDAETAISRSVAFGALTVMLLGIFAASGKVIEALGDRYLGAEMGASAGALGAAIAAAITVPLHGKVTRWAERRFQGDLIRLRRGLPALVADLRETATPQDLGDATLARVRSGVRAAHGAVVADGAVLATQDVDAAVVRRWIDNGTQAADRDDRLQIRRDDGLFPLRVPLSADGVGLAGWLLLGPRPDGSLYGRDERDALSDIADPVARALAIASRRSIEGSARAREFDEMRRRLAEVEAVLARVAGTGGGRPVAL